jgi:hypothetical protein
MGDTQSLPISNTAAASTISGLIISGSLMIAVAVFIVIGWYTGRWHTFYKEVREKEEDEEESVLEDKTDPNFIPPVEAKFGELEYGKEKYKKTKTFVKNKAKEAKRFVEKSFHEFSTRGYLWIIVFGVSFFSTLRYFTMIVTPSDLFQVRIGEDLPILFTRCNESLVNSGICGMTSSAAGYIIIFAINALGHAVYMKWTKQTMGIYVIFTAAWRYFIYLFVSFGMYSAYWTYFSFATLFGAVFAFGILLASMIDSVINSKKGDHVPNPRGFDTRRMPIIGGSNYPSYPTEGTITNTVNYGVMTWEFWINVSEALFGIFGYWAVFYVGPAGRILLTAGNEILVLFFLDLIELFLLNGLRLWTWTAKSDLEIRAVSSRMSDQSLLPRIYGSKRIGNKFQ